MSTSTLSKYERGLLLPHLIRAVELCDFYNAPVNFLVTGRGLNRALSTKLGTMVQRHQH